ncbi:MAG: beta-propeller fold lactonase family protein [Holophagales bacterium]|nr:MAG: beta-propeller fold lactonase family protein [Holophagales bacterium]
MRRSILAVVLTVVGLALSISGGWAADLQFVELHRKGVDGVVGLGGAFSVAVSPDGRHVYVTDHDYPLFTGIVSIFQRDAATGRLTFAGVADDTVASVDVLMGAIDVSVSPDGRNVYVSGAGYGPWSYNDRIVVFRRDALSGALTVVEVETGGIGSPSVANVRGPFVSPDGLSVYAPTSNADSIVVWDRDPATGELNYRQTLRDGVGGVDGLFGGTAIAVSSDGKNVYGVGILDNSISAFARNESTGELSFVASYRDGVGGVDGLYGVYKLAISPDGRNVYGAGTEDNALAVFARNPATGELTYLEAQRDGMGGAYGMVRTNAVAVSPDGRWVYTKGHGSLVVFARNSADGRLAFSQAFLDGVNGIDGLAGGSDVTTSPDSRNVYVAGHDDNALAVFSRLNGEPTADAGDDRTVAAGADCRGQVTLDGSRSSDPDGDSLAFAWQSDTGFTSSSTSPQFSLPLGVHQFLLTVNDGQGGVDSDTAVARVLDQTPPVMGTVSPSPAQLWPPNHKMVLVKVTAAVVDGCDPRPACAIADVSSNQGTGSTGGGSTNPDWQIASATTVWLRAERDGSAGDRIYTLGIVCGDSSGNRARTTTTVRIPHDQGH